MKPPQPPLLLLLLLLLATVSASPLYPKQLKALQSLNISTPTDDPCNNNSSSSSSSITCDDASPYRHITSLSFTNCSSNLSLAYKTIKPLYKSLLTVSFTNCPSLSPPHHLPLSLHSFSAVSSFLHNHSHISGLFLARLVNLRTLKVSSTPILTSRRLYVILGNMHKLTSLTISNSNLSGLIPKSFHSNLSYIDLSNNSLKGSIRTSITRLTNLESLNLSHNSLSGQIPNTIQNLTFLKTLSLASNKLSGPVSNSISSMSVLTHLDLSMNQLNGTVPRFFSDMKNLKHLNLADNSFHGILPFNESFIKNLNFFEIGGNDELCYNKTALSTKLKLEGIAPCDKYGLPLWSSQGKSLSGDNDYGDYDSEGGNEKKTEKMKNKDEEHNGSKKTLFGLSIGLLSLLFFIIFLIYLAKRCHWI